MGVFDQQDKDVLLRAYRRSIDNTWANLKEYMEHDRHRTSMPDFWDNFEILAKLVRSWRQEHDLPTWPTGEKEEQGAG